MKIFLDIDGVMVHANPQRCVKIDDSDGFYQFNDIAIELLNSIKFKHIEFILSTSHRFRYSKSEWSNIFKRRGIKFDSIDILDVSLDKRYSRRLEIEEWICINEYEPMDLIIIDDDKSLNSLPIEYKSRFYLTNSYTGMNSKDEFENFVNELY